MKKQEYMWGAWVERKDGGAFWAFWYCCEAQMRLQNPQYTYQQPAFSNARADIMPVVRCWRQGGGVVRVTARKVPKPEGPAHD